ncbi:hypothetical protein QAD02_012093 [Eretmocerus hayati]|uniref:Uncharacterized protein n=1 Tax=Eretmocerus hayati TaxID=131215 RepID=A0ACC2NZR0_9HYME|nr:hypothetical protein QAD02_012093 [Eretmocerus hayati]
MRPKQVAACRLLLFPLLQFLALVTSCSRVVRANPLDEELSQVIGFDNRGLDAAIELSELQYEDSCLSVAEAYWNLLKEPKNPEKLQQWKGAAIAYAESKKVEYEALKDTKSSTESRITDEQSPSDYKLALIKHPGDAFLNDTEYKKFVEFVGENRAIQANATYDDGTKNLTRQEIEYLLSHNGEEKEKLKAWSAWHRHFSPQVGNFSEILRLIPEAASANGQDDVKSYWEMLVGQPGAFKAFEYQVESVTNLHEKLAKFVGKRLEKKYNIEMKNDSIPAHLLGSLIGNDWTDLAYSVAPYPDPIAEIRQKLWERRMVGRSAYKYAANLGKRLLGQTPRSDFWSNSDFTAKCPSTLINFCKLGQMRVSTCNESSISNYLAAYKHVGKALLHQMSGKPTILNHANRYSVLEEGIAEFFSLLAASPAWLQQTGLMNTSIGSKEAEMTSLTITALDVLPRLAYYISADKWRLEAIEKNSTDPDQLMSSWWQNRLQYEHMYSNGDQLATFLTDDHIVNNQPYHSKILGIALAFQMYDYMFKSTDVRFDPFDKKSLNSNFVWMVKNNSENWRNLISKYMSIEGVKVDEMTSFFYTLDDYLDSYEEPENQPTSVPHLEESLEPEEEESKKKPKKNSAVYILGGALVATLTVCIIAIFGKKRCGRTPKNRRYV